MDPDAIAATVAALREADLREGVLEASGGIRPDNARRWAEAGVDVVSIGALTASAPALDFSLVIDDEPES